MLMIFFFQKKMLMKKNEVGVPIAFVGNKTGQYDRPVRIRENPKQASLILVIRARTE